MPGLASSRIAPTYCRSVGDTVIDGAFEYFTVFLNVHGSAFTFADAPTYIYSVENGADRP